MKYQQQRCTCKSFIHESVGRAGCCRNMSVSECGLIIFSSLLMAAITISYFVKPSLDGEGGSARLLDLEGSSNARDFPDVVTIADDGYDTWVKPELPTHLKHAKQTDSALIEHIRSHWILPPPSVDERRLQSPEIYDHSEFGQSFVADKLLKKMTNGFFVESCVGIDGESNSNTLFMEKDRQWEGLLIEPNPVKFEKLLEKRRKSFVLNACLSGRGTPTVVNFTSDQDELADSGENTVSVQCFPLYSVLAALQIKQVDYLSLRSEETEALDILKTVPFHKVRIRVVDVRTLFDNKKQSKSETNRKLIKAFLTGKRYTLVDAGDKINKHDIIMIKRPNR